MWCEDDEKKTPDEEQLDTCVSTVAVSVCRDMLDFLPIHSFGGCECMVVCSFSLRAKHARSSLGEGAKDINCLMVNQQTR